MPDGLYSWGQRWQTGVSVFGHHCGGRWRDGLLPTGCYLPWASRWQVWLLRGYRSGKKCAAAVSTCEHCGQENLAAIAGLEAALALQQRLGREAVAARGLVLAQPLRPGLGHLFGHLAEVAARYTAPRCNASDGALRRVSVRGAERRRDRLHRGAV